jgi:hypothetical protein
MDQQGAFQNHWIGGKFHRKRRHFMGKTHGNSPVSASRFNQSSDKIIRLSPSDRPGTVPLLQVHHPASGILWSETTSGSAMGKNTWKYGSVSKPCTPGEHQNSW